MKTFSNILVLVKRKSTKIGMNSINEYCMTFSTTI